MSLVMSGITAIVASPVNLLLIFFGVFVGIVFGAIPGLSATMALCLFLPVSFGLDTIGGISLLLGLYVGGMSGGLISAVLIKIPGTPSSIATIFDGGPMADRGEGGKAVGIGILYSFIGGIVSLIALIFLAPMLAKWSLSFTSVEYAAVVFFSLTVISTLSGGKPLLGIISGFLGMLLGCIGITQADDNVIRYTFGNHALDNGIPSVAIMIGLFAIGDFLKYCAGFTAESRQGTIQSAKLRGYGISMQEFVKTLPVAAMACLVGTGIGILPGIGGGIACMVAYGAAKSMSKTPEIYGTGCIEGLIASETSNNATTGGAMIPMLTLGIPGSPTAAMIMAGLMIHGVNPGPLIFQSSGRVMYAIMAAMLVANVAMLIMERLALPVFTKLLTIPKNVLLPCVIVMCALGCYTSNHTSFDIKCMLIIGLLGLLLKEGGISIAPCCIGYTIGPSFERYFRRTIMNFDNPYPRFFTSPISLMFLILAAIFIVVPILQNRKRPLPEEEN